jgi:hypothetical protein
MMGAPDPVEASSTAVGPGPDPGRGVEVTPARTSDPSGPRLSAPMPNPRVRPCDEGHRAAVTVGTAVLERRCQHLMRRGVPNLRGGWAVKRSFAPTTTGSLKLVDVIEVAGLRKQHRRLRGTEGTPPHRPRPRPLPRGRGRPALRRLCGLRTNWGALAAVPRPAAACQP